MTQSLNVFSQSCEKGQADLRFGGNHLSVQIDSTEAGTLIAGQSVKMVDSAGGIPKVIACAADEDDVFGFIDYDIRRSSFVAGNVIEIAVMHDSVMYMEAGAAIARNAELMVVITGSKVITATSTNRIIGRALDKAAASGDLIRVQIDLPGSLKA